MLFLGRLLKAAGLVLAGVGLANGLGLLINTLSGGEALHAYAYFALPAALAGLVPGGALFAVGWKMTRRHASAEISKK